MMKNATNRNDDAFQLHVATLESIQLSFVSRPAVLVWSEFTQDLPHSSPMLNQLTPCNVTDQKGIHINDDLVSKEALVLFQWGVKYNLKHLVLRC